MPTSQTFERRRAALFALNHYNSSVQAFPGGQTATVDATQAALTTVATLASFIAGRGVLPSDRAQQDRYAEEITDLYGILGVTDANIAADNTISAHQDRLVAFAATGVNKLHKDGKKWRN